MWRRVGGAAVLSGTATLVALGALPDRAAETASYPRREKHPCSAQKAFVPNCGEFKVFTGSAHPELARDIAKNIGTYLEPASVTKFNDGEISIKVSG